MAGYIGSKAVALSTTGADINGDANVDGSLTVGGATTLPTADINGGTIDGTVIGGTTPAAITATGLTLNQTTNLISTGTSDGADNARTFLNGGGSASINRGGNVSVYGSEYASSGGNVVLAAGDALTGGAVQGHINMLTGPSRKRLLIDQNGDISFYESTGTTPKFFWDASVGSLGIGTTAAYAGITVGQEASGGNLTLAAFYASGTATGGNASELNVIASSDNINLKTKAGDSLSFTTNNSGTAAATIDASGNVGIGTASPDSTLHVNGSGNISSWRLNTGSGAVGGSTKVQAANVTSTLGQFNLTAGDLELAAGAVRSQSVNFSGGTWTAGSVSILAGTTSLSGSFPSATRNEGVIKFGTRVIDASNNATDTERMRIDGSGSILIGQTTSTARVNGVAIVPGSNGYTQVSSWNDTTSKPHFGFFNPNGQVGGITTSGSSTAFNTSSDYRLKENITPVQGAADIVKMMRPCTYNFKADSTDWHDGFLAHELQELHPRAVTGSKDAMQDEEYEVTPAVYEDVIIPAVEAVAEVLAVYDDGGVLVSEGVPAVEAEAERTEQRLVSDAVMGTRSVPDFQGVDYSKLTPILTAALQEALAKIDALTARIETLEAV